MRTTPAVGVAAALVALAGCASGPADGPGDIRDLVFIGQPGAPGTLSGTNTGAELPVVVQVREHESAETLPPGEFSLAIPVDLSGPVDVIVRAPTGAELARAPRATDQASRLEELVVKAGGAELEMELESDPPGSTVLVEATAVGGLITQDLATVRHVVPIGREAELEMDGVWHRPCTITVTPIHPGTGVALGTPMYVEVPGNCREAMGRTAERLCQVARPTFAIADVLTVRPRGRADLAGAAGLCRMCRRVRLRRFASSATAVASGESYGPQPGGHAVPAAPIGGSSVVPYCFGSVASTSLRNWHESNFELSKVQPSRTTTAS